MVTSTASGGVVLVVDDLRTFPHLGSVTYARTSEAAVEALAGYQSAGIEVEALWLDHDLGTLPSGDLDDIRPVVEWLCEQAFHGRALGISQIVVHTSNPAPYSVGGPTTASPFSPRRAPFSREQFRFFRCEVSAFIRARDGAPHLFSATDELFV